MLTLDRTPAGRGKGTSLGLLCWLLGVALSSAPSSTPPSPPPPGDSYDRAQFSRWHLGTLGVDAGGKEWAKADGDGDGLVTAEELAAYEACCKFRKGFAVEDAEIPAESDGQSLCTTTTEVDELVKEFEAQSLSAEAAKDVLRRSLYSLGVKRVQSDGNEYGTLTTAVATAHLKELIVGLKSTIKQQEYDRRAAENLKALGKAPPPPCRDEHEDCDFFASEGECEQNVHWMEKNCKKSCGGCIDETAFFEGGFVKHLQGKKAFKRHRNEDVKAVVMFWTPECKFCMRAKPVYAAAAEQAAVDLPDVVFAGVDCSRNQATCTKQAIEKFPTFKWFTGGDAWADGSAVTYGPETNPPDPSILATTTMLSEKYDEDLMAELEWGAAEDDDGETKAKSEEKGDL